jgi:hypothetical protein
VLDIARLSFRDAGHRDLSRKVPVSPTPTVRRSNLRAGPDGVRGER